MKTRLFVSIFIVIALALPAVAQSKFFYSTNADGGSITIKGYSGPGGVVTVPRVIDGLTVTAIGDFAFARHSELSKITLPDSVTSIGKGAFTFVDTYSSLTNVTLGSGVAIIGPGAFAYCTRLTEIAIPASVARIGDRAFVACFDLTGIDVAPDNIKYSSVVGVLYNKNQTTLIQYPGGKLGNFDIPNSVTNIERYALWNCPKLTGLTVPDSITEIKPAAFAGCSSLTNVVVPGSVTYVGMGAFDSCISLREIYFEGNAPGHSQQHLFNGDDTVVYYLAGTTGWDKTFDGLRAVPFKP